MTTIDVLGIVKDFLDSNSDVSRLALADVFEETGDEKQARKLREGVTYYGVFDSEQVIAENRDEEDDLDRWITELPFATEREAMSFMDGVNQGDSWTEMSIFTTKVGAIEHIRDLLDLPGDDDIVEDEEGDDDGPS